MIVYTHIPKTAGSALTERLSSALPAGGTFLVTADLGDDGGLARRGTAGLSLVAGHIRFPAAWPIVGPATYIAAVRNPVERVLSHYFFTIRQREFVVAGSDLRTEFDRFYEIVRSYGWLDLQCRFFSADGKFERAAEVIEQHYAAVWDVSRTDEHFDTIIDRCGLDARNVEPDRSLYVAPVADCEEAMLAGARPRQYMGFLRDHQVERILDENAEDAKLYDWVAQGAGLRGTGRGMPR